MHFGETDSQLFEYLIDIVPCLRTHLRMLIALLFAILDDRLVVELPLFLVAFIASNSDDYVLLPVFLDLDEKMTTSPAQNSVISLNEDSAVRS